MLVRLLSSSSSALRAKNSLLLLNQRHSITQRSISSAVAAVEKKSEDALSKKDRLVFEVLDEKRGFRTGENLKEYLKAQFKANTISHKENVGSAVDKMMRNGTSLLLIVDDALQVVGLITDRDYMKFRRSTPASVADEATLVTKVMTPASKIVSVGLETSEREAINTMLKHNIRHLPVYFGEKKKLHGILYYKDFLHEPSRFDTPTLKALLGEHDVDVIVDDYSFSLTDAESVKIKERIAQAAKRLNLKENQ